MATRPSRKREIERKQAALAEAAASLPAPAVQLALIADEPLPRPDLFENRPTTRGVNERWRKHVLQTRGSPLEVLARYAFANPHSIAAEFKLAKGDALALVLGAARDLAPYVHSRAPVEANLEVEDGGALGDRLRRAMDRATMIDVSVEVAPVAVEEADHG